MHPGYNHDFRRPLSQLLLLALLLALSGFAAEPPLAAQFRYNGTAWDAGLEEETLRLAEVQWRGLAHPGDLVATPILGAPQLREILATDVNRLPRLLLVAGSGELRLSEIQQAALRDYLKAGGFLVAAGGDAAWTKAMQALLTTLLPASAWQAAQQQPAQGTLTVAVLEWREQPIAASVNGDLLRVAQQELQAGKAGPGLTLLREWFTQVKPPTIAPVPTGGQQSEEILLEPKLDINENLINELDSKYPTMQDR